MQSEYGVLTTDIKKKILGLNAARLYDIEVPAGARAAVTGSTNGAAPAAAAIGSATGGSA
jgi:hypothetical protein